MKKLNIIFLLSILFFSAKYNAQSILAGQHGSNDFYYDVMPDSSIKSLYNHHYVIYPLDINNDGIVDFDLEAVSHSGVNSLTALCFITPKNANSQIAFAHTHDCLGMMPYCVGKHFYHKMANKVNANNVIDNNLQWKDTSLFLSFDTWGGGCFQCKSYTFDSVSAFVGIRIFLANDTLYGWVKIKNVASSSFVLEEYAINKGVTGVSEYDNYSTFTVYPNPSNNDFTIINHLPSEAFITLYNLNGQELLNRKILETEEIEIDLSAFSQGMYFLKYSNASLTEIKKIVKY